MRDDHDVMGEFFEDDGLALQGTAFGHVYWITAPKRREWTREDEEAYNLVCLSQEYMDELRKGFDYE